MISGMTSESLEFFQASVMYADSASPAAAGTVATTNEGIEIQTWDFDQTTPEAVWIVVRAKGRSVSVDPCWTCTSGVGNVYWSCDVSDALPGSTLDVAASVSVSTGVRIGSEVYHLSKGSQTSTPVAPSGLVAIKITRQPGNPADTLNADARLIGVMLRWL